jgi:hypothetical protein
MSRAQPAPDCLDVELPAGLSMGDTAEVALEDYARALTGAGAAEAVRDGGGRVAGIHLCGLTGAVPEGAVRDVEGFARSLVTPESGGLGWS